MKQVMSRMRHPSRAERFVRLMLLAVATAAPVLLGVGVNSARAQSVPPLVNFQGRLTDNLNNPLTGSQNLVFEVYDASSGGNQLWTETQNGVSVVNGVLAAQLGSVTPLPPSVFDGTAAWLQITVNGTPLSPRQRLIAVPYALQADRLQGREYAALVSTDSATQSIAGAKTFTGTLSVPAPSLPAHAVTKAYVDSLTGGGNVFASTNTWSAQQVFLNDVRISTNLYVTGFMGAGTTAPTERLDVVGNIRLTGALRDTANNNLLLPSAGTLTLGNALSGNLAVNVNGNTGVGTLSPAAKLDVEGNAQFGAGAAKSTFTAAGVLKLAAGPAAPEDAATKAYVDSLTGGGNVFASTNTWSAQQTYLNMVSVSTDLVVTGASRFGSVSSFSAAGLLSLGSGATLDNTSSNLILFNQSGLNLPSVATRSPGTKITLFPSLAATAADYAFGVASGVLWYTVPTNAASHSHRFYANTTELMRVGGDGRVGIGATAPAATLDVNGDAQFGSGATKSTFSAAGVLTFPAGYTPGSAQQAATKGYVDSLTGGGNVFASTNTWSAQQLFLNDVRVSTNLYVTGRLGAGTAAPQRALHVVEPGTNTPAVLVETGGGGDDVRIEGAGGGQFIGLGHNSSDLTIRGANAPGGFTISGASTRLRLNTNIANPITLETNGQERMRVDGAGRVGISTGAPQTALDVQGDAQFGSGATKSTFSATGALTMAAGYTPTAPQHAATKGYVDAQVTGGGGWTKTGTSVQTSVAGDTVTITGDAFSVGGATLAVRYGRVGIGTTNPLQDLDVNGAIRAGNHQIVISDTAGGLRLLRDDGSSAPLKAGGIHVGGSYPNSDPTDGEIRASTDINLLPGGYEVARFARGQLFGVGTATPTARLHVSSVSALAGETILLVSTGNAAGQELLQVKGDGRLVLSPSYSPSGASDAATKAYVDSQATGSWTKTGTSIETTVSGDTVTIRGEAFSVGGSTLVVSAGRLSVAGNASTPAPLQVHGVADVLAPTGVLGLGFQSLGSARGGYIQTVAASDRNTVMTFTSGSDVGIGTSAPQGRLDVEGSAQFGLGANKSTFSVTGALTLAAGFTPTAPQHAATKAYVDSGAGETNTYASTKTFTQAVAVGVVGASNGTLVVQSTSTTALHPVISARNNAGTEVLRAQQNGVVYVPTSLGLGTAAPATTLHVDSAGTPGIRLSASGAPKFDLYADTAGNGHWVANGGGSLVTRAAGLNDLVVAAGTGNVGVSTSAPATKLDVNGNASFGAGAAKSTFSATGALTLANGSALTLSGPGGVIAAASSVTASAFFGDGSNLTGIAAGETNTYASSKTYTQALAVGVIGASGGTLVVRSTSATSGNPVLSVRASGGTEWLRVQEDGSVGVGTSAPSLGALHVNKPAILERPDNAATYAMLQLMRGAGPNWGLESEGDGAGSTARLGLGGPSGGLSLDAAGSAKIGGYGMPAARLDVEGNAQFGSGAAKSTFSATGALTLANGSALTLSGPGGVIAAASSVTASAFFGDGSNLTGIAAGEANTYASTKTFTQAVAVGVLGASNGTLIVQSTSTTNANPILSARANSGAELFRVQQDGKAAVGAATTLTSTLTVAGQISHTQGIVSEGVGYGTTAGNARGLGANDLQTYRLAGTQVAAGSYSTIGGGRRNTASTVGATVAGGEANSATTGSHNTVGGGESNTASGMFHATVAGGFQNTASGWRSAVGGGYSNQATAEHTVVPGGEQNTASGNWAFAAGRRAKSTAVGAFTWADSQNADATNAVVDGFMARAQGGFYVNSSSLSLVGASGAGTLLTIDASSAHVRVPLYDQSGALLTGGAALLSSTNTWTAQQNHTAQVRVSSHLVVTGGSLLHVDEPTTAAYARLEGADDGDNYGALEIWSKETPARKWQFAHKSIAAQRHDFNFAHYDGTSWSSPLTLTTGRRAGVGVDAPLARLHVSSAGAVASDTVLLVSTNPAGHVLAVMGDGKVGIGTANPSLGTLQVSGPGTAMIVLENTGGAELELHSNDGSGLPGIRTNPTSTPLSLQDSGDVILSRVSGRVGVGTPAPATPLDVNGSAQFGSGATKSTFSAAGVLTFPTGYTPSAPLQAATKGYVDSQATSGWTKTANSIQTTVAADTVTITGNAFSVAGTTLAVTSGRLGLGTSSPQARLHLSEAASVDLSGRQLSISSITSAATLDNGGKYIGLNMLLDTTDSGSGTIDQTAIRVSNRANSATSAYGLALDRVESEYDTAVGVDIRNVYAGTGNESAGIRIDKIGNFIGDAYALKLGAVTGANSWGIYQTAAVQNSLAGRLGLGVASPSAKLQVAGDVLVSSGAAIGGATPANGTLVVRSTSTTGTNPVLNLQSNGGAELVRVQQNGNVGIGDATPAARLTVNGGGTAPLGGDLRVAGRIGAGESNSVAGEYNSLSYQFQEFRGFGYNTADDTIFINGSGAVPVVFKNTSSSSLVKFGVGTSSPSTRMDIDGDAQFGAGAVKSTFSAAGVLTFPTGYTPSAPLQAATKGYVDSQVTGGSGFMKGGTTIETAVFGDSVTVHGRLRVQGLGTEASPSHLMVSGADTITAGDAQINIGQTAAGADLRLFVTGTDSRADGLTANDQYIQAVQRLNLHSAGNGGAFYNTQLNLGVGGVGPYGDVTVHAAPAGTTGVERLRVTQQGRVGIGTTAPSARLHVSSSSAAPNDPVLIVSSGGAAGQELLTALGDGRVGVGTGSPAHRFHVSGGTSVFVNRGVLIDTDGGADVHIGAQQAATGTPGEAYRLALQPYGHTGGPFNFVARDTVSDAFLDLRYATGNQILTLMHNGNAGLGAANPSNARLSVQPSAANEFALKVSSQDATGSQLVVDKFGNVGIGTGVVSGRLQVNGSINPVNVDNESLGSSSYRWGNLYLTNTLDSRNPGDYTLYHYSNGGYSFKLDDDNDSAGSTTSFDIEAPGGNAFTVSRDRNWFFRERGFLEGATTAACSGIDNGSTPGFWLGDAADCSTMFFGGHTLTDGAEVFGLYNAGWRLLSTRDGLVGIGSTVDGLHYGTVGKYGSAASFTFGTTDGLFFESGTSESGGFFANGDVAAIWSPGDTDILQIYDEDNFGAGPLVKVDPSGYLVAGGNWSQGNLQLSGLLTGYGGLTYPTLKTTGACIYFDANSTYTGYICDTTGFTDVSDGRLKKDVRRLDGALDKISRLNGVRFRWNGDRDDGKDHIGVIAQNVEEVVPELVSQPEGITHKGVEYKGLNALAIEAIKELKARVEELEARLAKEEKR